MREKGREIGLEIRDPERSGKRIGPTSDLMCGDEDYEKGTTEEEIFVRLGGSHGDYLVQSHTLTQAGWTEKFGPVEPEERQGL